MNELIEREVLARTYEGVPKIPLSDFAKMIGKTHPTAKKIALANNQLFLFEGTYYVSRNLSNNSSVSSQTL